MSNQRVLFLCIGNSARSQMAEAFLRKYAGDTFDAHSAGLEPKGVNPLTVRVMDEVGIDISRQTSKGIETYLGKVLFQYLITVCDDADKNCPTVWPGVNTDALVIRRPRKVRRQRRGKAYQVPRNT
jgi:arsenate reductase